MNLERHPIVVVGAGYVGLTTAVGLARVRQVRLVDRNSALIEQLEAGEIPIAERGLGDRFSKARQANRLTLHNHIDRALGDGMARIIFVAVGTPSAADCGGRADLSQVYSVMDSLLGYRRLAVVMKSTVPPGTGDGILRYARARGSDLTYVSCPEFLQEGRAVRSFDEPDRVVVGSECPSWASEELAVMHGDLYRAVGGGDMSLPYLEMDIKSAEMVKHASNLHLALRVSYANEMANLCEESGADIKRVMDGVGADRRIGTDFLESGIGFGGSCFEKDIKALRNVASEHDVELSLGDAVLAINSRQIDRTVQKLEQRLGALSGKHVAILGLAFKPDTDDLRGSPAFSLAARLREEGATIRAWDPEPLARARAIRGRANSQREWVHTREVAGSALDALRGADAVVIATQWDEFAALEWSEAARVMTGRLVLDGRNCLSASEVRKVGLQYEGVGREGVGLGGVQLGGVVGDS